MTIESKLCPTCKCKLSKHAPPGYCPDCSAKDINTPPPTDPDLFVASDEEIRAAAQFCPGSVVPAAKVTQVPIPIDDIGIDILLVTHEELAAIAAERPEINAALIMGPCQMSWRGVRVQPVDDDAIDAIAVGYASQGARVARLQPGHAMLPGDPRWQQLAEQELPKQDPVWKKGPAGPWHWFPDGEDGDPCCGCDHLYFVREQRTSSPPEAEMCSYCWAIICDSLVSSIDTTEVRP
jgi:hypothetical protein